MEKKPTFIKLMLLGLCAILIFNNSLAQNAKTAKEIHVKGIPFALTEFNSPVNVEVKNDSTLVLTAGPKTNLFNSPGDNYYKQDAPMLLFHPDSNFTLIAKVEADLKEVYDVAAIVLYQNNDLWAKLCFENSVDKETTVVSVVTKRFSDDCNSNKISDRYIYYAVAKKGDEFSFHYSTDKTNWHLVRHFRMEFNQNELMVGFAAHCSKGEKFSAEFSEITYSKNGLASMRKFN